MLLDFELHFHSHCNITSVTYKQVGRQEGSDVGGERGWTAGGGCSLLGLFGLAVNPRDVSHRLKHA